ncbi:hypothetical protein ILUMI_14598, partial [Ignelater luminosus]
TMDAVAPKTLNKEVSGVQRNLLSGLETCDIVPLNPHCLLDKLPKENSEDIDPKIACTLTEFLRNERYNEASDEEEEINMQIENDSDNANKETHDDEIVNEYYEPTKENVIQGKFVLIRFLSGSRKKNEFRYVCIVQSILEEQEVEVLGLK